MEGCGRRVKALFGYASSKACRYCLSPGLRARDVVGGVFFKRRKAGVQVGGDPSYK